MIELYGTGPIARWEEEGGALPSCSGEFPRTASYFRDREGHCRARARECVLSEMRSTYLGFAARYAALARGIEAGNGDLGVKLKIV